MKNIELNAASHLSELYKSYTAIEKRFGELVFESISAYLPADFDKKNFHFEDLLGELHTSGIVGDAKAVIKVSSKNYSGDLSKLAAGLSELDGKKVDDFILQIVTKSAGEDMVGHEQVHIILKKQSKEKVKKDQKVSDKVDGILTK